MTTTISHIVDTDLYSFAGVAGERAHIILGSNGGSFGFDPQWRLLGANGAPAAVCGTLAAGERECVLPAAGTYAVEVRDAGFNATGTYSLQLQRLTEAQRCAPATLACDTPVTTTISHIVDTDLYNFAGVAGERAHIILGAMAGRLASTRSGGCWERTGHRRRCAGRWRQGSGSACCQRRARMRWR